jgi:hypothetical protein
VMFPPVRLSACPPVRLSAHCPTTTRHPPSGSSTPRDSVCRLGSRPRWSL